MKKKQYIIGRRLQCYLSHWANGATRFPAGTVTVIEHVIRTRLIYGYNRCLFVRMVTKCELKVVLISFITFGDCDYEKLIKKA